MEKRLVLSFVLSFLVLYVWASLFQKPEKKNAPLESSEVIQTESFSRENSAVESAPSNLTITKEIEKKEHEKPYEIEMEKFLLKFSNLGGSLDDVLLKEYNISLPLMNIANLDAYNSDKFEINNISQNTVEFNFMSQDFEIRKLYTFCNNYLINIEIFIKNKSTVQKVLPENFKCFTLNMNKLDINENLDKNDHALYEYVVSAKKGIKRKNKAFKFGHKENQNVEDSVNWVGFRNRYYCAIGKPNFVTNSYSVNMVNEKELDITVKAEKFLLNPDEERNFSFTYYIGPEKTDVLSEYKLGFEGIKRYYKFGLFDNIAKLIDWIMRLLFKIIPNWGVSIILVSIIIYYSMYPLTARGMASMKKMQLLQPKIQALKEKYEKNPQKLNQEMLELYRKEKINPLGGCFPILLQMPVFVGLYQVLWRNVDFKGAGFLWIKDLSQPDRLFLLKFDLPVIGNEINLLPILMVFIMFFQQKFSSKNMVLTDPMQIQQQKMMTTIMPIFLGFIFYKFASGLTLYFTMFYIFSTLTQWKLSKEAKG